MKRKLTKKHRKYEILPPLLFAAKTTATAAWMLKLKQAGRIQKIGPRLYSSVPSSQVESAVRGGWKSIVAELYPDSIISHRSALEFKPTSENILVLTSSTNKNVKLPGLTLQFIRGPAALHDDPIVAGVRASSTARAFLENLSATKNTTSRALKVHEIEQRLEKILSVRGATSLNEIRGQAKKIALKFKWQREFTKLDKIIGALLGTRSPDNLKTPSARARSIGKPYDSDRLVLFDNLFAELRSTPLVEKKEVYKTNVHFRNKAFFEAYFSNYIEGTRFEIKEAEEIIFDKKIPHERPQDGHDILSTFNILSDPNEMSRLPESFGEFIDLLKSRHKILMSKRPEVKPGVFKEMPNRVGSTHFVQPELLAETLAKGFERYQDLPEGMARAIFMMFLVADVHPFKDGNGRVARVMMNAELYSKELSTIIIPTVYREDYLGALRALSQRSRPEILIKVLSRAHLFSNMEFSDYPKALQYLQVRNWFYEPGEATIKLKN
jgi:hypothetical protein